MAAMKSPGALAGATGTGLPSSEAAGFPEVADMPRRGKRGGAYQVTPEGGEAFTLHVVGREAWALERLAAAGPVGCTPINQPAPRWSAYVHRLRESGVPIETLTEKHGGEFAGNHARYLLRAAVQKGGAA
jgi:hypothetical protein